MLDLAPPALRRDERLFPVGRLDGDSTGLLLLTNDGDFAFQLTHPKFGVAKEYRVLCAGLASDEQLQKLRRGMYLITPGGRRNEDDEEGVDGVCAHHQALCGSRTRRSHAAQHHPARRAEPRDPAHAGARRI